MKCEECYDKYLLMHNEEPDCEECIVIKAGKRREEILKAYCRERNVSIDELTLEQIKEIRNKPEWKNAVQMSGNQKAEPL